MKIASIGHTASQGILRVRGSTQLSKWLVEGPRWAGVSLLTTTFSTASLHFRWEGQTSTLIYKRSVFSVKSGAGAGRDEGDHQPYRRNKYSRLAHKYWSHIRKAQKHLLKETIPILCSGAFLGQSPKGGFRPLALLRIVWLHRNQWNSQAVLIPSKRC